MTSKEKPRRGPEPDRLKLTGNWEDRVADSFKAPPPKKKAASRGAKKKARKAK